MANEGAKVSTRAVIKLFITACCIVLYFPTGALFWILFFWSPNFRLSLLNRTVRFYSRIVMWVLGFKIKTSAHLRKDLKKPALLVSNHLSYTDIMVLASQAPMCFVTSVETKELIGLGWIVQIAGCLFVERRDKSNIHNEVKEITAALRSGHHVVVFPEATSTNGEELLRFRSPLFQAAIDAGVDVKTMALNYDKINGKPITTSNRDLVAWYGDMSFMGHILPLCGCRKIHVSIAEGSRLKAPHAMTSKELALQSFNEVSKIFKPFKS